MFGYEDLHTVFSHLPSKHLILDEDMRVLEVTNDYLESTHTTRDIVGKNVFEAVPERVDVSGERVTPKLLELVRTCFRTRKPQSMLNIKYDIFNTVTRSLERRYWNVHTYPVINGHNTVRYIIYTAEDITEEASLRLSLDYAKIFQLIVETVKDYAIFMMDTNGYIRTWNEGARRLKQYTADEIIGKHFTIFYTAEDLAKKKPEYELEDALKNGRTEDEYWRVRKDGSKFWADVIITALYNDNGHHIGFAKVTRDLTDRKRSEEQIIAAYEDSARLKSEFLANMSHEIRTPMNGVVSAATLLTDTPLIPEQKELVSLITKSSDVLVKVINDILDYFKMESNEMRLVSEVFDVSESIARLVQNFELIKNKPIVITVQAEGIPKVKGDVFQFKQVVTRLVDNAIKFTESGSVRVVAMWDADKKSVTVQVSDTGIGIAEEDIPKLFSPFMQLDPSTKKQYRGTGLGLSICKKLVDLMGGKIGVQSQLGIGSTFWFSVPLELAPVEHKDEKIAVAIPPIEPAKNSDVRILIAEDNVINQTVALKILKKLGYHNMTIAEDGVKAVEMFKNGDYDVVLMDIQMPNMDGYEATAKIREIDPKVPIIAMTANALKGDAERAVAAGMNDYLSKPLNFALVAKTLNRWTLS